MKRLVSMLGLGCAVVLLASAGSAADWRFRVGLSYMNGFQDVADAYRDNVRTEGGSSGSMDWASPTSLALDCSYLFDHGGVICAGAGPFVYLVTDGVERDFVDVPLACTYGYVFRPKSTVSPHARLGVRYHLVSGDYVEDSIPGVFGMVGVELLRDSKVGAGVEVGYDSAVVVLSDRRGFDDQDVAAGGVAVSVFAVF